MVREVDGHSDPACRYLIFAHLVVKLPRPEDSEESFLVFDSSYHVLLPVDSTKKIEATR